MSRATLWPLPDDTVEPTALLSPLCQEGLARLSKLITARPGKFQLILLDCRDERLRDRLIEVLDGRLPPNTLPIAHLRLTVRNHPDFSAVEQALITLAGGHGVIHVTGGGAWFDPARWESFNIRREAVARGAKASLLFWLDPDSIENLARIAIDLWAWRSAVVTFTAAIQPPQTARPQADLRVIDNRDRDERRRRIDFLRETLRATDLPNDIRFELILEFGDLLNSLGQIDEAEAAYGEAEKAAPDERSRAGAIGRIADILFRRGELDEALHIRRDKELPAYRQLGETFAVAVTQGDIADILFERGELDEALRIRREEELPVYTRFGDIRSAAVTQGQIADILFLRGELDEALRIQREEALPVYTRLGDLRSVALAQGRIADILFRRGELDEALRIRREEELPVHTRLGEIREVAVTQGKIADILFRRGELDEALSILHEKALPVFIRLGDIRSVAVTHCKIADILFQRGELDEALRVRREEALPVFTRLGDIYSVAATQGEIADVLIRRGELDEALRILREKALPIYTRLGDIRSVAIIHGQIAEILFLRDEMETAEALRSDQLEISRKLNDPDGIAAALWGLARIALARDDRPRAVEALREAWPLLCRLDRADALVVVGEAYGGLLLASGERATGTTVLTQAAEAARRLGWNDQAVRIAARADEPRLSV